MLADRYGVELEREAEDPRDAAQAGAAGAAAGAAGAHRRLLRARAVGGGRGRGRARVPGVARAGGGGAARVPGRLLAVALGPRAGRPRGGRLHRGGAAGRRAGVAAAARAAGCSTASAGGSCSRWATSAAACSGFGARALREDQRPKYLNTSEGEVFHKGRMVYGADLARAAAARAGRVVLVEGYTDVIALRQAGVPEAVGSMGTALTDAQVDELARLAPTVLFCQDPDAAGQNAVAKRAGGAAGPQRAVRRSGGSTSGSCALPRGPGPGRRRSSAGADGDARRCWTRRSRSRASRSSARSSAATSCRTEGRDRVLDEVVPIIAPLPASVLREELVQLVAGRLGVSASTRRVRARRPGAPGARRGRPPRGGRPRPAAPPAVPSRRPPRAAIAATPARSTATTRGRDEWTAAGESTTDPRPRAGQPPAQRRRPRLLDRREQTERAFLAYCLALPEEGERGSPRPTSTSSSPRPRPAAPPSTSSGRLRTPAADLPRDDDALARLVAELVIRAGELEATPAKLELEALQLDLSRLDRLIAGARVSGGEGMRDLAAERQRVLDAIRHRLTVARFPSGTRTSVRVMEAAWLRSQLDSGARSSPSPARPAATPRRSPTGSTSTASSSTHAARHAPRGGIDREDLAALSRAASRSARWRASSV